MTWANFYFFCFMVGFLWAIVSFLLGHLDFHLPHIGNGNLDHGFGHIHAEASHAPSLDGHHITTGQNHVSFFNFGSLAAFLAWFGGVGFLLTAYSNLWFFWGLCLSICSGTAGALIIFWFLAKVLARNEKNLDPMDYEMVGVLGRICSPIRAGGTGEIIFSQEGVRQTCGARSEEGIAISKGTEVVVTKFEKGIAYVRLWDELNQSFAADGQ